MKKRLNELTKNSKKKYYSLSKFEKMMFLSGAIFILVVLAIVFISAILNAYPYTPAGGATINNDIWQIVDGITRLIVPSDVNISGNLNVSENLNVVGNITGKNLNLEKDLNVNNTFFVNSTSGRVGIGTGSPNGLLDVGGEFIIQPNNLSWTSGLSYIKNITMGPGDVFLITASYNPNSLGSLSYRKQITKLVGFQVSYDGANVVGYLATNTLYDSSSGQAQAQGQDYSPATLTTTFTNGAISGGPTSETIVFVNLTTSTIGSKDITIVKIHDAI